MELLTVIKCPAAWGRRGARPNPSIIGACSSCTPDIYLSCTLYALCAPPWRRGFCTLVLFICVCVAASVGGFSFRDGFITGKGVEGG